MLSGALQLVCLETVPTLVIYLYQSVFLTSSQWASCHGMGKSSKVYVFKDDSVGILSAINEYLVSYIIHVRLKMDAII